MAKISHQLRNPLNSALLQLAVMERRVRRLTPELQVQLLETLSRIQQEMLRTSDLLDTFVEPTKSHALPR